jgi:hypothetical protein
MYRFLWRGLSVQGFVSIQKLDQGGKRGKLYDARVSTVNFCGSYTVRSRKWRESWFATGYHALSSKRDILKKVRECGVLLVGNPIQTILHMPFGSPFVGYGT